MQRDDDQWQIIKEAIDSSDYYILIIGNRYGSIEETTGGVIQKKSLIMLYHKAFQF